MSDLVAQLRKGDAYDGRKISCKHDVCNCAIMSEAADEIERLRVAVKEILEMCRSADGAPMTADRWIERIEERAKLALEHTQWERRNAL